MWYIVFGKRNVIMQVSTEIGRRRGGWLVIVAGSRQTFFASQIIRFADLYTSTVLNLLHYPFCYLFKAPPMLVCHYQTGELYNHCSRDVIVSSSSMQSLIDEILLKY